MEFFGTVDSVAGTVNLVDKENVRITWRLALTKCKWQNSSRVPCPQVEVAG